MAAAPMSTVRANRRETALPQSSWASCFCARQTSWEGLRFGTWRCDEDLAGVVRACWCRKHAVEAIFLLQSPYTNAGWIGDVGVELCGMGCGLARKWVEMFSWYVNENGWFWILIGLGKWMMRRLHFFIWDKVVEAVIGATWIHVTPISSAT